MSALSAQVDNTRCAHTPEKTMSLESDLSGVVVVFVLLAFAIWPIFKDHHLPHLRRVRLILRCLFVGSLGFWGGWELTASSIILFLQIVHNYNDTNALYTLSAHVPIYFFLGNIPAMILSVFALFTIIKV